MACVNGRDTCGGKSYVQVTRKDGKIHIFTPEDASDVILNTKQAKQLIEALQAALKEQQ